MAGGVAWFGEVGDFVVAIAGGGQGAPGELHQVCPLVLIRQVEGSLLLAPLKHGARFDAQVVDRQMGGLEANRLLELLAPSLQTSPNRLRHPLDQIQAPTGQPPIQAGLRQPARRLNDIGAPVAPPEVREHLVVETLAAQADPVDSPRQIAAEPLLVKAGRIQFQGDLRPGGQAKPGSKSPHQIANLGRREQGWGAAPEIDRGERRPQRSRCNLLVQQP